MNYSYCKGCGVMAGHVFLSAKSCCLYHSLAKLMLSILLISPLGDQASKFAKPHAYLTVCVYFLIFRKFQIMTFMSVV